MTPRLIDFIFHFPFSFFFFHYVSPFSFFYQVLYSLFPLKFLDSRFLCVHIKRRTCALRIFGFEKTHNICLLRNLSG